MEVIKADFLFHKCLHGYWGIAGGFSYNLRESRLIGYDDPDVFLFITPSWRYLSVEPLFVEPARIRVLRTSEALKIYRQLRVRREPLKYAFPPGADDYPPAEGRIFAVDPNPQGDRPGWPTADLTVKVNGNTYRLGELKLLAHSWPIYQTDRLGTWHTFLFRLPTEPVYIKLDYHGGSGESDARPLDHAGAQNLFEVLPWKLTVFFEAFGRSLRSG